MTFLWEVIEHLPKFVLEKNHLTRQQIDRLVEKRSLARKNKDFKTVDELESNGY